MDFISMGQGMLMILVIALLVLSIVIFKKHTELLLNFLIRGVFGAIVIYFLNEILVAFGLEVSVGINAVSLLTSAALGIPGVALLYGVMLL